MHVLNVYMTPVLWLQKFEKVQNLELSLWAPVYQITHKYLDLPKI